MTFCYAPFVGMTIDPNGWINLCCNTNDNRHFGVKIQDIDDLNDFFIGEQYKKIRSQISSVGMENVDNDVCEICRKAKQVGSISELDNYTRLGKPIYDRNDLKIKYLEFTSSNTCNQTCVMCNSYFSTKWNKIEPFFRNDDLGIIRGTTDTFMMSDNDIEKIIKILPSLKILQIKGGEPTSDKRNLRIVKELAKVNPDCKFIMTSNFQKISDEWFNALSKLNNVCTVASIDGVGKVFDWIRGGDFEEVEFNLYYMKNIVKVNELPVLTCVSLYNLFSMRELWERYSKDFAYTNYNVIPPRYSFLSPGILSRKELEKILFDQFGSLDHPGIAPNILNNKTLEEIDDSKFTPETQKKKFIWWTETMNKVRGFDIFDLQPQLREIFK